MYSTSMHRERPSQNGALSDSSQDEYDSYLSQSCASEGLRATDVTPVAESSASALQVGRQRTRDRSKADATGKIVNRNILNMLSTQPSPPVVNAERVVAQHDTSYSSCSTSRASERLGSLPITPPRQTRTYDPPSTTRPLRTGLNTLGLYSPSKKGKRTSGRSDSRPKKTIVVEDDDEDEMNEVSNYFAGFESPPTPPSASPLSTSQASAPSLIECHPSSSSTAVSSSWSSAGIHQESSSWDSIEVTRASAAGRKRARPSDTFDAEAIGISSASVSRNVADGFSAPRTLKARKEDHPSSPKKTSLEAKPITMSVPNDVPPLVTSFFRDDSLSRNLQPHIIAYDHSAQQIIESLNLAWGVQYELARGVTSGFWTWEDIRKILRGKPTELQGSNADAAPQVANVMLDRKRVRDTNAALWKELDREQAALVENKGRGLGMMGPWHGEEDWFGGQIQQVARLKVAPHLKGKDSRYTICLDPMEKRRSHRFSRFCGSRRILQLRIEKDRIFEEGAALKHFLQQKFVLCGRIFVPFYVKDHNLYMVETNEDWMRAPSIQAGDNHRLSFSEFINWHNPPEYNCKQALSKYVTRIALGLSTSVPALEFEAQNIFLIDDIYGSEYRGGRKASAEETMTDGCGFINRAALHAINSQLNKRSLPVAIQGRIAGAKGLWILHPDDTSPEYKIWIRESQNKIKYTRLHRAHRIFELVTTSQPSNSVSITTQPIVNLAYNGVPHATLLGWLENGLVEEIQPLIDWDRPHSGHLWMAIYKAGSVGRSRLVRITAGFSRAQGLARESWKNDEIEQIIDADTFEDTGNTFAGRNQHSGAPFAAHELALELFQAGFHPRHSTALRKELNFIIEQEIKRCVEKYAIPLAESLSGFVIPDPLGVLAEGEIYYRSSESLLDPRTQLTFDIVTGDVILGRYPVRLASDLQKVKAVNKPELYQWPDVIIISTKGTRSLASLLSGGDMDGDTLFMLREPDIVDPFENQPFVPPPGDLYDANFKKHVESVRQFCERLRGVSPVEQQTEFQSALLLSLNEDRKGLYSMFHDHAIEKYGYNHPKAVRLAYIFNTLLDASKSGLTLLDGVFERDQRVYTRDRDWERPISARNNSMQQNVTHSVVGPTSDAFILTKLKKAAEAKGNELREKFKANASLCSDRMDQDLVAPYDRAAQFANDNFRKYRDFGEDLQKIRAHVYKAYGEYSNALPKHKHRTAAYVKGARMFAEPVVGLEITSVDQAEELKASFAYREYFSKGIVPFQLAFRKLCEIKARSVSGGIVACTREIDEMRTIPGAHIRAVEKSYYFEDADE